MVNWFDEFRASVEDGIKLGIQGGFESLGEMFKDNLEKWMQIPEPFGPYQRIRSFDPKVDFPISQGYISVEQDSWEIFSYEERKILMFEIPAPIGLQECILLCQMQVKSSGLQKPANLSLSMQNFAGWNWSRTASIEGTKSWHRLHIPFHYKKAEFTGAIQLNVEFKGSGVLWIKDVEILQAAVKP